MTKGSGLGIASDLEGSREIDFPESSQPEGLPGPMVDWQRIARVVRTLWHARAAILRRTGIGLVACVLIALIWPPWYESTGRVLPPEGATTSLSILKFLGSDIANTVPGELLGTKGPNGLYLGLLRSRNILNRVIHRCDLQKVYGLRSMEKTRKRLLDNTEISEDRKSGIIKITVSHRNKDVAAQIARAYVEEFALIIGELNTSAAHKQRVFLEERLKASKEELDQAAVEFSKFASANTAIDIEQQGKAMLTAVAQVQGEMIAAQSELKGLEQVYTPNNVRVRSVRARITELNHQLQKLGGVPGADDASGKSDPEKLFYPSIRTLPLLGVRYFDLFRKVKVREAVYETLTKQFELARVEEAQEMPGIRVVDTPDVPELRAGPPRLQIIGLGTLFCFLLSLGWMVGANAWDNVAETDVRKTLVHQAGAALQGEFVNLRSSRLFRRHDQSV